ncbi:protein-disulfide reductase DsbD family protein [Agaribacterium haliotis]|uniref:protein-disulfide reductase DsbD family protein n=1 Tax=Agaribacterium haliotis TaxID=2013869 RepID=UPI0013046CEB|nr:protein-disulfide reductase DsbD [Agaribacterium haliotis]
MFSHAFAEQDEFLPVEKAYHAQALSDGNNVEFIWQISDGYYLYRHQLKLYQLGQDGKQKLEFRVPDGKRKYDEIFEKEVEVYYHDLTLSAALNPSKGPIEVELHTQGCADAGLCYPPRKQWYRIDGGQITEISAPSLDASKVISSTASTEAPATSAGDDEPPTLLFILLGAAFGGMILNLMPCVFPVLSLKALSLAGGDAREHRINGWAYTGGVVVSFMLVGLIIVIAKSAGANLGWGFQLQQPIFVAALVYLFALLALNLFGMFEVGTSFMGVGQNLTQGTGVTASFFTGVLAAVVASPCTAPFMASAIGFTLTQGPIISLIVFFSLGFGMALPYLILSHSPKLADKMPRPGPWMETFKQFLAFPLLFTCVWLLIVVGEQTSAYSAGLVVAGTIALCMAIWLLNKQPSGNFRWVVRALALVLAVSAGKVVYDVEKHGKANEAHWQVYSPELLRDLRANNQPVFVDLTADWCITCKVNERVAINIESVQNFASENKIAMVQGDWTSSDPVITELLHKFGRNGVPLYLMYPANGGEPEVLPQILTAAIVLEAMEQALTP